MKRAIRNISDKVSRSKKRKVSPSPQFRSAVDDFLKKCSASSEQKWLSLLCDPLMDPYLSQAISHRLALPHIGERGMVCSRKPFLRWSKSLSMETGIPHLVFITYSQRKYFIEISSKGFRHHNCSQVAYWLELNALIGYLRHVEPSPATETNPHPEDSHPEIVPTIEEYKREKLSNQLKSVSSSVDLQVLLRNTWSEAEMKDAIATFSSLLELKQQSLITKWEEEQANERREEIGRLHKLNDSQDKMEKIVQLKGTSVTDFEKPLAKFFSLTNWSARKKESMTLLILNGLKSPEIIYDLIYVQTFSNTHPELLDIGHGFTSMDWLLQSTARKVKTDNVDFDTTLEGSLEPLLTFVDQRTSQAC